MHALTKTNLEKKQNKVKQKRCLSIDIVFKINVLKSMIWIISNVEGSKVSRLLVWVCIWIWMKPFWATFWPNYLIVMFVFSLVCKLRNNSSFLTHQVSLWMGKVLYALRSLYMIRSSCICGSLGSIAVTSNVNKSPTLLLKLRKFCLCSIWEEVYLTFKCSKLKRTLSNYNLMLSYEDMQSNVSISECRK